MAKSYVFLAWLLLYPSWAQALTLVYSNDILGELEPCGCKNNPQGGWERKAEFLKKLKDPQIVQVDSGNLLFESPRLSEAIKKQARLQAKTLVNIMNQLKHDAVVPGPNDFALGLPQFKKYWKQSRFTWVGSNLHFSEASFQLKPYVILKRKTSNGKNIRIGIIGLAGEKLNYPPEVNVNPVIPRAKELIKQLKNKTDILIALTHQGLEEDKKLAQATDGIHIILGAGSSSFLQTPVRIKKSYIYQTLYRNRWVGKVKIDLPFKNREHQLTNLDAEFEPTPLESHPIFLKVKKFNQKIAKMNLKEEETDFAVALHEPHAYQTLTSCVGCHETQFDFWRKTKHADALLVLKKEKQHHNKDCLRCHTLGLGQAGGWSRLNQIAQWEDSKKPAPTVSQLSDFFHRLHQASSVQKIEKELYLLKKSFAPVQCENCHQIEKQHPMQSQIKQKVSNKVCLSCHQKDRSPKWYDSQGKPLWKVIQSKKMKVACPLDQ